MDGQRFTRISAWLFAGRPKGGSPVRHVALVALALFLAATLGIAEPISAAGPHAAGKKSSTERRTFSSPNALLIPDASPASPYPSAIKVSGFKKGKIKDVNVLIRGINHGFPDDIDVMLVAPDGQNAILMSDAGGGPDALSLTINLDDQAGATLPDNVALANGAFRPTNHGAAADPFPGAPTPNGDVTLSTFNGGNPNGTWRLFVVDDDAGQVGAFSGGWDLKITAKVKKEKKHKKL